MWLDGFLKRHHGVRQLLARFVPTGERSVMLLGRSFTISPRFEIGLLRLSRLLALSPTAHELGPLISIAGLLQPGCTFIDVGANVGLFSVPLASLGDVVGFTVVAVEPNKGTAGRLRQSLAPYKCASVIEAAASSTEGTSLMGFVTDSSVTYQLAGSPQGRERLQNVTAVQTVRLDDLRYQAPWVLKIDVEGHEAQVLDGLAASLQGGRVKAVVIDGFGDPTIPSRLRTAGFRLWNGRNLQPFREGVDWNLLAIAETDCQGNL